jgi:hypothetical protein
MSDAAAIRTRLLSCPKVKLNDGNSIPILGLGVYQGYLDC